MIAFEEGFPIAELELSEFERRIKKLIDKDNFISVRLLLEAFKDCP